MPLPRFLQPYLASYDLSKLDVGSKQVKKEVITQILNQGNAKTIRWLFNNMSLKDIIDTLKNPQKGVWSKRSYFYWQKILGVKNKVPEKLFQTKY